METSTVFIPVSKKQKAKQAMKHQFVTTKLTEAPLSSLGILAPDFINTESSLSAGFVLGLF